MRTPGREEKVNSLWGLLAHSEPCVALVWALHRCLTLDTAEFDPTWSLAEGYALIIYLDVAFVVLFWVGYLVVEMVRGNASSEDEKDEDWVEIEMETVHVERLERL
jgi:hypothetical protein